MKRSEQKIEKLRKMKLRKMKLKKEKREEVFVR